MRTILNKPIFINPQAYYVFPQLYEMQGEGDGEEWSKHEELINESAHGE